MEPVLQDKIRLDIIFREIFKNKKKFVVPLLSTFIVSCLLSLCIPRYYTVKVMLAPEYSSGGSNLGGLSGFASMVGINMGQLSNADAINPGFYPDLMVSSDFLVPLLYTNVTTNDSLFSGRLIDYILDKQKAPFWDVIKGKIIDFFVHSPSVSSNPEYRINPFKMNKTESDLIRFVSGSISCNVDKKTDVITIKTTTQDPLVSAILADTVKQRLQNFITDYRTSKARNDLQHIEILCKEAAIRFEEAQKKYAEFADSHQNLSMQSYKIKADKYSDEMEVAHSSYNALYQQKLLAEAKVRERMPVFTTLQNASVPVKHSGPKRMMIVIIFTMISFFITSFVVVVRRKE